MKPRIYDYMFAISLMLLISIVFANIHDSKVILDTHTQEIYNVQQQIKVIDDKLSTKADETKINTILSEIEELKAEVELERQDHQAWNKMWDALFGREQAQYLRQVK